MKSLLTQDIPDVMSCMLMPVMGQIILLPSVCVAEVNHLSLPDNEAQDSWYMGAVQWRGLEVPMISLEQLLMGRDLTASPMSRLLVLNAISGSGFAFWAMPILGLPKTLKVSQEQLAIMDQELQPGEKAMVKTEYGAALLPDLDYIEAQIAEELAR